MEVIKIVGNKKQELDKRDVEALEEIERSGIDKEQQAVLVRLRMKSTRKYDNEITNAMKRVLMSTDEEGLTVAEKIAVGAVNNVLKNPKIKDVVAINKLVGESTSTTEISSKEKVDVKELLKEISSEGNY